MKNDLIIKINYVINCFTFLRKEIESNNDGQVNKNKKKTEKNKDQNISDIQENNKKQIFFPHNEQINEYGLLESR